MNIDNGPIGLLNIWANLGEASAVILGLNLLMAAGAIILVNRSLARASLRIAGIGIASILVGFAMPWLANGVYRTMILDDAALYMIAVVALAAVIICDLIIIVLPSAIALRKGTGAARVITFNVLGLFLPFFWSAAFARAILIGSHKGMEGPARAVAKA